MPSGLSRIQLKNVRKSFGRLPVLRGVSCTFRQRELGLIMGPNGAGKSTLLSILATLSRPTRGEVTFDALPLRQAERRLRGRVGLVAHAPMLYGQMSALENLVFFARVHGLDRAEERAGGWLERVGLTGEAADRPAQTLSRGMAQRVSLARALLCEPWLLLLDEPFTGLDRGGAGLLRRELGAAVERGVMVVVVSHDARALDRLAGQLVVLRQGRVVEELREPAMATERLREVYHGAT